MPFEDDDAGQPAVVEPFHSENISSMKMLGHSSLTWRVAKVLTVVWNSLVRSRPFGMMVRGKQKDDDDDAKDG